jgi:hypothetical protein
MIESKAKTKIICSDCGKELMVRNDYLNTHKGRCNRCASLYNWKDECYSKKCSESHKNQDNSIFKKGYGESNFNALYGSYRRSAQSRGIEFNITKEQFKIITQENCYYCGIEPLQKYDGKGERYNNGYWIYNGIDRKDDRKGYEINNCVPSCKICNYAKQGLTDIEFLNHVKKIYNNHIEKDSIGSNSEYSKN